MNHTLTVSGAYSTDFKNKKDAKRFKVGFLNVRYSNLRKIAVIDVNKDKLI